MKAICSIFLGREGENLAKISKPLMTKYAKNIGAEFEPILGYTKNIYYEVVRMQYEKFQLFDLLDVYERIIFIDADIIVKPSAPNLFDIVPVEKLGAFVFSKYSDLHDRDILEIQNTLEKLSWQRTYINTGVLVVSRRHKEVFRTTREMYLSKVAKYWSEQTQINYNIQKLKVDLFDIDYKFNHLDGTKAPIIDEKLALLARRRLDSYFIHYAGVRSFQWGNLRIPRTQQMEKDLNQMKAKIKLL